MAQRGPNGNKKRAREAVGQETILFAIAWGTFAVVAIALVIGMAMSPTGSTRLATAFIGTDITASIPQTTQTQQRQSSGLQRLEALKRPVPSQPMPAVPGTQGKVPQTELSSLENRLEILRYEIDLLRKDSQRLVKEKAQMAQRIKSLEEQLSSITASVPTMQPGKSAETMLKGAKLSQPLPPKPTKAQKPLQAGDVTVKTTPFVKMSAAELQRLAPQGVDPIVTGALPTPRPKPTAQPAQVQAAKPAPSQAKVEPTKVTKPKTVRIVSANPNANLLPKTKATPNARITRTQFGIEVGQGKSMDEVRKAWKKLKTINPGLFGSLRPIIRVGDAGRKPTNLHLVAGPFGNISNAAVACAQLSAFKVTCRPVPFDGQALALR